MSDGCLAEIKKLDIHIEEIEKMIKILLVNNLIDESICVANGDELLANEDVILALKKYNLQIGKENIIDGRKVVYFVVLNKIEIKEIMYLHDLFMTLRPNIEPVFQFKKINGMQRKRMMQEKISYYVVGKELHIFSLRGV